MKQIQLVAVIGLTVMGTSAWAQDKPALGVWIDDDPAGGALVKSVYDGSPAAKVGMKAGDRIVAVNKQDVAGFADVMKLIGTNAPNAQITVEVMRGMKRESFAVVLGRAEQVLIEPSRPIQVYRGSTIWVNPGYQYRPSRPGHWFFNRPDAGGGDFIPPPIPPDPVIPPPPIIVP